MGTQTDTLVKTRESANRSYKIEAKLSTTAMTSHYSYLLAIKPRDSFNGFNPQSEKRLGEGLCVDNVNSPQVWTMTRDSFDVLFHFLLSHGVNRHIRASQPPEFIQPFR